MLSLNIPVLNREAMREALQGAEPLAKELKTKDRQLESRYSRMESDRKPFLDEARNVAQASIPFLYPPEGTDNIFSVPSTNQSLVSKGIINLAKELSSTIMPANARFFEHKVQPEIQALIDQAKSQAAENPDDPNSQQDILNIGEMNNKLVARMDIMRQAIKASPDAENFYQGMVHCEVAGQFVFFKPNLETSKIYTLESFVVEYDSTGEPVDILVKDIIHFSKFSQEQLKDLFQTDDPEHFEAANLENIVVYTRQVRRWDHWEIQVEICGKRYAPMEGREDLDAPPFIVVPFFLFPGQKYAVSWLTYNKGDILQFENMSLSVNKLAEAACKVVAMIPPEAKVTQKELAESAGMSYIFGSPAPIQMIFADISKNLQAVTQVYELIRASLLAIFLLDEAVRRDAERVSAEEIKTVAMGLRKLLGGLYLSMARRWQYPYVNRIERLMEKAGKITKLDSSQVQTVLTAGLETLESAEELQSLTQLMQLAQLAGPEGLQRINIDELLTRLANYLSVVKDPLFYTDEQMQENAGVQQIVQIAKQLGPQGPQMFAQMALQMLQSGGQPQQGNQPPEAQPSTMGQPLPQ